MELSESAYLSEVDDAVPRVIKLLHHLLHQRLVVPKVEVLPAHPVKLVDGDLAVAVPIEDSERATQPTRTAFGHGGDLLPDLLDRAPGFGRGGFGFLLGLGDSELVKACRAGKGSSAMG